MNRRRSFALVIALPVVICAGVIAAGRQFHGTNRRTVRRPTADPESLTSQPQSEEPLPNEQPAKQPPEPATALPDVVQLALAGEMDKVIEMHSDWANWGQPAYESPHFFMTRFASLRGTLEWLDTLDKLVERIEQRTDLDPIWRWTYGAAYGAWGRQYVKTQGTLHDLAAAMVHRIRAAEPSLAWKRRTTWLSAITSAAVHTSPTPSKDSARMGRDELAEQGLLQLAREAYAKPGHGVVHGELFALACIAHKAELVLDPAAEFLRGPAADTAIFDVSISCSVLERRGLLVADAQRQRVIDLFRLGMSRVQRIDSSLAVLRTAVRLRLPGLDDVSAALCRRIEEGPPSPTRAFAVKQCREYQRKLAR